jgi:biopolymer transport protein ExbD
MNEEEKIISEINITPLTDIFLVLLIIFMVTTPFLIQSAIKVNLPKSSASEETIPKYLIVSLTRTGQIFLNEQKIVSIDHLIDRMKTKLSSDPNQLVIINADEGVYHGQVVEILDAVKKAGAARIGIGIEKKEK